MTSLRTPGLPGWDREEVRRLPAVPSFRTRTVRLAPGQVRAHDEDAWRGALVVVDAGEIELCCAAGGSRTFGTGSVLWFTGLDLVCVRNPGTREAVFRGITREPARPGPPGRR